MRHDSTSRPINKDQQPRPLEQRLVDLSSMMDNHLRYMHALFVAIKATAGESSKVAVDLAALGQFVAENTEDLLDASCSDVLLASREVH